jgi:aminoglycoside phosphotransferase (APT) family kinase protein
MIAVPPSAANWKTLLLRGKVEPKHFRQCGELLASLHRESSHRRGEFEDQFSDLAYFESLRLEPYYEYTAAAVPGAAPFLLALASGARTRKISLVHGDFSPKNLLLDQSLMILLDHEVIHLGDPAFDIGFLLAHFLSKAHHLALHRAALLEGISIFHQTYVESVRSCDWAPAAEPRAARHALGCLLARAAGRSQLEYLSEVERARQIAACVQLVQQPPETIGELAQRFIKEIH